MEKLELVNGNNQYYSVDLPTIHILTDNINDSALKHIKENTGLWFEKKCFGYVAKPSRSDQIVRLFLTYNFKTKYYNNYDYKNIIFLKFDHNVGFKIDSVCYDCCKRNGVYLDNLKQDDLLAC